MAEVIVVHGYAGSGKTTHCERLTEEGIGDKSIRHISAGNRVRAIRTNQLASRFSERIPPSSIPDDIINGVIFEALEEDLDRDVVLVDGYPRYARTVDLFHTSLHANDHAFLGTVFLHIPREVSIDRVAGRGQREGDTLQHDSLLIDAKARYNRDAQRVRRATRALGRLAIVEKIDASGDQDTVYSKFRSAVGRLLLSDKKYLFDKGGFHL